jgi:hypothetical protein
VTNEELAEELLKRLKEFSPALSIRPGQDDDQVIIEIAMSRTPVSLDELDLPVTSETPASGDVDQTQSDLDWPLLPEGAGS